MRRSTVLRLPVRVSIPCLITFRSMIVASTWANLIKLFVPITCVIIAIHLLAFVCGCTSGLHYKNVMIVMSNACAINVLYECN
jgi:hypothetical protein